MNHSYWRCCRPRKHEPAASDSTSLSCHAELLDHDSSFRIWPQLRTHQAEGGREARLPFHRWKSGLPWVLSQNDDWKPFIPFNSLSSVTPAAQACSQGVRDRPRVPKRWKEAGKLFLHWQLHVSPFPGKERLLRARDTAHQETIHFTVGCLLGNKTISTMQPRQQWQMGICSEIYNSQVPSLQSPLPNTLHMRNENIFLSSSLPRKLIRKNQAETEIVLASLKRCLINKKCCL